MHGMHLLRHVRGNPEIAIKMKPKQDCVALYSPNVQMCMKVHYSINDESR